jgi:enoyl-CoA hydratase/carnithine racemase
MSEGQLIYEKVGHIARITFDNRPAHNALTWTMWGDLGRVCTEIAQDRDVRVVTMRGAGGKAFISGTDIGGFLSFESGQRGVEYERQVDIYIGAVEGMPQPTVAVVEGWAVGGGLALAFASDFRIATPNAKFGSPLGRTIGNCLSMKGYARLVSHVGIAQAKRILMLGEMITATELQVLGLVNVVAEPDALDGAVDEMCEKLASMAPLTIKSSKEAIRRLTYANLPNIEDLIEMVYGSEDFRMGVRNFVEKKKPEWTGR